MRRIGIIGVGLLGSAVASRLLGRGFQVAGYDTRPEQVEALALQGLRAATSMVEAAAGAEAIFTVLPTPASVDIVFLGGNGLMETAPREATIVQMSTISPEQTRRLGAAAAAKGLGFLDAPMSGTSAMVARGDCTILVGGAAPALERCRPALDAIAPRVIHVGGVGMASLAKLVTNLIAGVNTAAVAEALVLGMKGGLAPGTLLEFLNGSGAASKMLEVRGPLMASHRFDAQMKLDLFLKDFRLMLEEARRLGVALPLTMVAHDLCAAASANGHGPEDLAAIITTFERLARLGEEPRG
jgi:3-hydroxyisobutyrate dehydrogenase-like beta-hydroxyacid dehydrogenase